MEAQAISTLTTVQYLQVITRSVLNNNNTTCITARTVRFPPRHAKTAKAIYTATSCIIKENPKRGLIFHTDQGSQFGAIAFMQFCALSGIQQSMSRAGCPYDNAPMERFYNTFKCEYFSQHIFYDPYLADTGVYRYILDWYNQRRPHSYNDGLPPAVARKSSQNLTLWCYKNA